MTILAKYYDMFNEGNMYPTYTKDFWIIPEEGTEIWCTYWKRGQHIKPYGDTCHVVVGTTIYHKDELMSILLRNEKDGYSWGLDGVTMIREQKINGYWQTVL